MSKNFRIYPTLSVIAQGLPTGTAAGAKAGDPVRNGGVNGVNRWGTGKGQGVPTGAGNYGMLALNGVVVTDVVVATTALKENDPIYITSGNVLNNTASGNTLFGYADEPGAVGTVRIGVRISNAIGA